MQSRASVNRGRKVDTLGVIINDNVPNAIKVQ